MRTRLVMLLLASVTALAGCSEDSTGTFACTADSRPNIVVEVRDSLTGVGIAQGATGRIISTAYTSELVAIDANRLFEVEWEEHAGTYRVEVERPGYAPRQISNIVVPLEDPRCDHVVTQGLVVRMFPKP